MKYIAKLAKKYHEQCEKANIFFIFVSQKLQKYILYKVSIKKLTK